MVEEAQERKGRSQRFIERFGARYSPAVLAVGILIAVVPPVVFNAAWATWISRATVFIVAAAPCALVISIPITLVASLGTGARQGVLIKGGVYVEELAKVKIVALAEATVGIAMGAAGTDVALETADVALMADDLEKLSYALRLARRNQAVVGQNLALSALVHWRAGHRQRAAHVAWVSTAYCA